MTATDAAPSPWTLATVVAIRSETLRAKTYRLTVPEPLEYRPGQHVVLRLTAPDGYTASRSYSIASAPTAGEREFELTVERLDGGEVSEYLHDMVEVGDSLEVRGPIGGWFVWTGETPVLLVGGGSGVVPVMSMLRYARANGIADRVRMIVSARTPDDLLYADELAGHETTVVYTRSATADRPAGRLAADDLPSILDDDTVAFVCGSTGFCDTVGELVMQRGLPSSRLRFERFGAT